MADTTQQALTQYPGAVATPIDPTKPKPRVRLNSDGGYTVFGGGTTDWFGPNFPIAPVAPPEQRFRAWDYPTSINPNYTSRRGVASVPYSQLYNFATYYDLARLLVERRKNQIAKLEWNVQPRDAKKKDDARCQKIEAFFRRPDGEHFWQQWIKKLLNDVIVYDAGFVFPLLDQRGNLLSLEVPDGTTFKFLVDERGLTPAPPWPAYQQIIKGTPGWNFTRDELLFFPFNPTNERVGGYSVIEQVIVTITMALNNQASQLSYFTNGATPDMILSVPETWSPEQVREWKAWWDAMLAGNLAERRGTMFVPNGMNPINTKDAVVKTPLDEWIARVMCFAFGETPAPFVANMNRATAESLATQAQENGVGAQMDWTRAMMDYLIDVCFDAPDLCFRWQEEDETDPKTKADTNDIKIKNATKTINEAREEDGLDPVEGGNEPLLYAGGTWMLLKDVLNPPEPPPALTSPGGPDAPVDGAGPKADAPPGGATEKAAGGAAAPTPFEKRGPRKTQPSAHDVKHFAGIVHGVMKQVEKSVASQLARRLGKANDPTADDILGEIDMGTWSLLSDPFTAAATGMAEDGFTDAILEVGGNITQMVAFGLPNTRAVQYAQARAAALIGSAADGGELADATREMLRSTITTAIGEAWSTADLERALADDYAFSASRAETIARTELKSAMSAGNAEGWRASGVVTGKVWQVSNDDVCDICIENEDAGEIGIDETFPSGDDMPGAHPNCNCVVYPVVGDSTED